MLTPAERRLNGERGFTLIELLVVMIIIAILMAVAVPTFLRQKQSAIGTKAKANIKTIVTAVESCAASNIDGKYHSSSTAGAADCTDTENLKAQEPAVGELLETGDGAGATFTVNAGADAFGYSVVATVPASGGTATITETHTDGGQVTKTCTNNVKICGSGENGKW